MIDTDKYEGHAKEGWHFDSAHVLRDGYDKEITELVGEDWLDDKATQALIADAPLLLAEVKRLREDIVSILGAIDLPDYDEFPLTREELRNMMVKYGQEHLIHEVKE